MDTGLLLVQSNRDIWMLISYWFQGLYRVGGVISKVKKLLKQALDPAPGEEMPDMSDPKMWETKTLASAVKQYFRDLSKPLMTYQLYTSFLEAVKKEAESPRLNEIYLVTQKLPRANREILKVRECS